MALDRTAYGQIMDDFSRELAARWAQPLPPTPSPTVPSPYFTPEQAPDLLIYVGPAQPDQLQTLRAQLPPASLLFYLHPAVSSDEKQRLRQSVPPGRTLTGTLDGEGFFLEKTALLLSSLPDQQVRLVVEQGFRATCGPAIQALEDGIRNTLENLQQDRNRGMSRLRCSLRNLPSIYENSDATLPRLPAGVPAIVCGAGPSLRSQFGLLKELSGRAILIATGHAVPELVKAGIVPHVVVEVDSHAGRNWPEEIRPDSLLVACTEVAPEVAERFSRVVWCHGSSPVFTLALHEWGLPLKELQLARTVTVPAIDFAMRLGCSKIALVGQDLCLEESGLSHVDGETLEGDDELLSAPGNETAAVKTTRTFVVLREALQAYLKSVKAALGEDGPSIVNCTQSGAVLEGIGRESLERFGEGLPPLPADLRLVTRGEKPASPVKPLQDSEGRLRQYGVLAQSIVDVCGKLRRELEQQPMNMDKVRTQQRSLQQLIAHEEAKRQEKGLSLWLQIVVSLVDRVMQETPGLISQDTDPFKQLHYLETRYGFIQTLGEDLRRDMGVALRRLRDPALEETAPSPLVFKSFREQGLQRIAAQNRELAARLRKDPPACSAERFQIRWMNQHVPFVKYRGADGVWRALSGFTSMFDQAAREVEAFVRMTGFDPARQAVVFAAPGNWVYVLEFSRRYPQAQILVLEPWVGLLSALIDRGVFLHLLPPRALIVGVGEGLAEGLALAQARWTDWQAAGLAPLLFRLPALADRSEMSELLAGIGIPDLLQL